MFDISLFNVGINLEGFLQFFKSKKKLEKQIEELTDCEKKILREIFEWNQPYINEKNEHLIKLENDGFIYSCDPNCHGMGRVSYTWKLSSNVEKIFETHKYIVEKFPLPDKEPLF